MRVNNTMHGNFFLVQEKKTLCNRTLKPTLPMPLVLICTKFLYELESNGSERIKLSVDILLYQNVPNRIVLKYTEKEPSALLCTTSAPAAHIPIPSLTSHIITRRQFITTFKVNLQINARINIAIFKLISNTEKSKCFREDTR